MAGLQGILCTSFPPIRALKSKTAIWEIRIIFEAREDGCFWGKWEQQREMDGL